MEFRAEQSIRNTRYWFGIGITLMMSVGFLIFYPILLGKGFMFFEMITKIFSSSKTIYIIVGIILYSQLAGYLTTQSSTKVLKVLDNTIIFTFFNGKILELNYSDISYLNYTKDIFKNFQFTLKNGETKVVYASVKDKEKAFELINQKIEESINHT